MSYSMNRRARLCLHPEQFPQDAPQHLRRFPNHDIHSTPPFHLRQQAQPQLIKRNATKNSSTPTGKIAAIRIPAPRATENIPSSRHPPPPFHPPLPHIRPHLLPSFPVYTPPASMVPCYRKFCRPALRGTGGLRRPEGFALWTPTREACASLDPGRSLLLRGLCFFHFGFFLSQFCFMFPVKFSG